MFNVQSKSKLFIDIVTSPFYDLILTFYSPNFIVRDNFYFTLLVILMLY